MAGNPGASRIAKLREKANEYFQQGKYDRALKEYRQIVEYDPRDSISRQQIANCLERLGEKTQAVRALIELADHYLQDGRSTHALATLRRANRLDPSDIEIMERLVDAFLEQNNPLEARAVLTQLVDAYTKLNRLTKVLDVYNRLIDITPNDIRLRQRCAQVKAELGRKDEAAKEYADITTKLVEEGKTAEAINVAEQALKYFEDNKVIRESLIEAYLQNGQYQKVILLIESIQNKTSFHWLKLGIAYAQVERFHNAHSAMVEALRLEPDNPDIYLSLMKYSPIGSWDDIRTWIVGFLGKKLSQSFDAQAWNVLEHALDIKPADNELLNIAIHYLKNNKQDTKILEILDRAVSHAMENEHLSLALRLIDQILQVDPENDQYREKRDYLEKRLAHGQETPEPQPVPIVASVPTESVETPQTSTVEEYSSDIIDEEEIREYILGQLTEAEVFYRYGMVSKSIDELERLIRQYPLATPAEVVYQKLYRIYLNEGHSDRAIDKLFQLLNFYQHHGSKDKIPEILNDIKTIRPDDARLEEWSHYLAEGREEMEVLEISSEIDGIEEEIQQTLEGNEDFNTEIQEINFYLQNNLLNEARQLIDKWTRRMPDHPELVSLKDRAEKLSKEAQLASAPEEGAAVEEPEFELDLDIELESSPSSPLEESHELIPELITKEGLSPLPQNLEPIAEDQESPESFLSEVQNNETLGLQDDNAGLIVTGKPSTYMEREESVEIKELEGSEFESEISKVENISKEPLTTHGKTGKFEHLLENIMKSTSSEIKGAKLKSTAEEEVLQQVLDDLTRTIKTGHKISTESKAKQPPPVEPEIQPPELLPTEEMLQAEEDIGEKSDEIPIHTLEQNPPPTSGPHENTDELALEFMDLAQEFEQEFSQVEEAVEAPPDEHLHSTIEQFKQKVDELVPEEDARTHFDLGLAYLQMGLLDESIVEFQKAAKNPEFILDANYQLADCFIRKGFPDAAVKCYKKILESVSLQDEYRHQIQYQMAQLYEDMGELEKAYELYLDVLSNNAGFRDVKSKLQQLENLRNQKPQ